MSWPQTLTPAPSHVFVLACLPPTQTTTIAHTFSPGWNDGSLSWSGASQRRHRMSRVCRVSCGLGGASSEEERWQREESRWMREEQRWMRDESRWQREEARWNEERKAWAQEAAVMADEMRVLKQEIEELRVYAEEKQFSTASLSNGMADLKNLMESLNARPDQDSTSVSGSPSFVVESSDNVEISEGEILLEMDSMGSIPSMSEFSIDLVMDSSREAEGTNFQTPSSSALSRALKRGAEGNMVKALHEALAAAGFHSGEDEMEYSSFSHSTESAVKTWQASIGAPEDGVVTSELLEILLGKSNSLPATSGTNSASPQGAAASGNNGTITQPSNSNGRSQQPSVPPGISNPWGKPPDAVKRPRTTQPSNAPQKPEPGKTFAEKKRDIDGTLEQDISQDRRVFLLGENRWEEPSRLVKPSNGKLHGLRQMVTLKCFSCRGERVTMCTECEGTGDLNVEDQFLEWVDEGAKCPYCEGSGAVPCDLCSGIGAAAAAAEM